MQYVIFIRLGRLGAIYHVKYECGIEFASTCLLNTFENIDKVNDKLESNRKRLD